MRPAATPGETGPGHNHHRQGGSRQDQIDVVDGDNLPLHQIEPADLRVAVLGEQEDAQGSRDDVGAAEPAFGQAAPPPIQKRQHEDGGKGKDG